MEEQKTHIEIDPVTGEVTTVVDESPEQIAEKQLWGKNPGRAHALRDILFDELMSHMDDENIPPEKRWEMTFMMAVNSTIDLILDSLPTDTAMDVSYCFDNMLGLALANKKYDVNILAEAKKAMESVDPKDFPDEDMYVKGLQEFEERWWDMGQPALGMRSPNDAIYEALSKYGLNEE